MKILTTPAEAFQALPDYPFAPHFTTVDQVDSVNLNMHHVEQGEGGVVLLLHGEPSWSYLYRKMIPIFAEAGYRAVAPDLIGFGRSDKPSQQEDYSYQRHVDWLRAWLVKQDLCDITLVCQDWGGLIGLRLLALEPKRFARVVAANTFLPIGKDLANDAFLKWRDFASNVPVFDAGKVVRKGTVNGISDEVMAAYNAPYPDESYKAGARVFPSLVPINEQNVAVPECRKAWQALCAWDKPFLTAFSDQDPITAGFDKIFQKKVPGATGQDHTVIQGGGHFLQEDKGEELAAIVLGLLRP